MPKNMFIYLGLSLIVLAIAFFAGYFWRSGEVAEIKSDLRDAVEKSEQLREQNGQAQRRIAELEKIEKRRREKIEKLRGTVSEFVKRSRARDQIIARLEGKVGELKKDYREIGELAKEGRGIVKEMLESKSQN